MDKIEVWQEGALINYIKDDDGELEYGTILLTEEISLDEFKKQYSREGDCNGNKHNRQPA
jgi:hypothetical protein